jgi:transposase
MSRYRVYSTEQVELLPPSVHEVLGGDHLCFFVHRVVERLDLGRFHEAYTAEGGLLYHPSLLLKVWLYAYALGITSSRRLEQRIREDLAFRYLAGGAQPDYWALNAFRRRHARALNDVFTQVLELARHAGLRQLGTVAIDTTRVKASASPDRVRTEERQRRARVRRKVRNWQQACNQDDNNEGAGGVAAVPEQVLDTVEPRLKPLPKPRLERRSLTDPEARFLRARGRFVLGYTAEIAVSDDHLIVAQRVTQAVNDNAALLPMVDQVQLSCGSPPGRVLADSGFFSAANLEELENRSIDGYVPDSNLARELNLNLPPVDGWCHDNRQRRMREKMRTPEGRQMYRRRKALVEPVFGVLKEQRGMRGFRMRGLERVNIEFTLAALAWNLTRLHAGKQN